MRRFVDSHSEDCASSSLMNFFISILHEEELRDFISKALWIRSAISVAFLILGLLTQKTGKMESMEVDTLSVSLLKE